MRVLLLDETISKHWKIQWKILESIKKIWVIQKIIIRIYGIKRILFIIRNSHGKELNWIIEIYVTYDVHIWCMSIFHV